MNRLYSSVKGKIHACSSIRLTPGFRPGLLKTTAPQLAALKRWMVRDAASDFDAQAQRYRVVLCSYLFNITLRSSTRLVRKHDTSDKNGEKEQVKRIAFFLSFF